MPPRKEPLELPWSYLIKRIFYFKKESESDLDFLQRAGMTLNDKSDWSKTPAPNVGFQKLLAIAANIEVPTDHACRGWFFSGDGPPPPEIIKGPLAAGGDNRA